MDDNYDAEDENCMRLLGICAMGLHQAATSANWASYILRRNATLMPQNQHTRQSDGLEYVTDILEGHDTRCYNHYRVSVETFYTLCEDVLAQGIVNTERIHIWEQVAMFLQILAHGTSHRMIAEEYQHSYDTVKRKFDDVLDSVCMMQDNWLVLPGANTQPHVKVADGPFKGALGAIDGTHIKAHIVEEDYIDENGRGTPEKYRCGRKNELTQNVLAAVDFDMKFVYVYVGFEGSGHDMKVLGKAIRDSGFVVPPGRYYLADAGYANTRSFISPYRGVTYHLAAFQRRRRHGNYTSPEEKFNHKHSQLRNVVERAFGILKGRWKILLFNRPYKYITQMKIVSVCCILHNYIKHYDSPNTASERVFLNEGMEHVSVSDGTEVSSSANIDPQSIQDGGDIRESIKNAL